MLGNAKIVVSVDEFDGAHLYLPTALTVKLPYNSPAIQVRVIFYKISHTQHDN